MTSSLTLLHAAVTTSTVEHVDLFLGAELETPSSLHVHGIMHCQLSTLFPEGSLVEAELICTEHISARTRAALRTFIGMFPNTLPAWLASFWPNAEKLKASLAALQLHTFFLLIFSTADTLLTEV